MYPKELLKGLPTTDVPMPDVEIKNYKGHMGQDSICFVCSLYVNGVNIGHVNDPGMGGGACFNWFIGNPGVTEAKAAWDTWVKSLGVMAEYPELTWDDECVLNEFLKAMDSMKWLKRHCKNKLVFLLKGDAEGSFRTLNGADSAAARKYVTEKYGSDIAFFGNDIIKGY